MPSRPRKGLLPFSLFSMVCSFDRGVNDIDTGFRVRFKFKEIGYDCR